MIEVRALRKADEADWRRLWNEYNEFYQATVSDAVTDHTWRRLCDRRANMIGRIAIDDGAILGFSNSILHAGTWTIEKLCYLEDLYVAPAARGRGVGKALIDDLIRLGRAKSWNRIYWHTRGDNATARRLYDRFCPADDFVRYRLWLKPED
jgi:ribosomal protein S18 acetylase RimI-like enzyme